MNNYSYLEQLPNQSTIIGAVRGALSQIENFYTRVIYVCCVIDLLQRTRDNLLPYLVLCACTSIWVDSLLGKIGS